ncbi:hypothetical protein [Hyphococcus sp.]|uniref:hypothetical protein n=1 Tax=Hyphococcus sp. TaxID=2038636 RepID=UPI00208A4EBB|nr:MAG: hypothetical protein DHS20C04_24090 [Marinicaulis sp.]
MILRRVIAHFRKQEWTAIALDFLIVVMGVFVGLQVNNWNEARAAEHRKDEIIAALITDLEDAISVQENMIVDSIDEGLASWSITRARGEFPPPYYFRITGSDTAPEIWDMLQKMEISGLFDPVMLFDLTFYYSEQRGVGQRYIRYVTFVENQILPYENGDPQYFYEADGAALKPEYQASMDRLREYSDEVGRLSRWASCLVDRLRDGGRFEQSCLRADASIATGQDISTTGGVQ